MSPWTGGEVGQDEVGVGGADVQVGKYPARAVSKKATENTGLAKTPCNTAVSPRKIGILEGEHQSGHPQCRELTAAGSAGENN